MNIKETKQRKLIHHLLEGKEIQYKFDLGWCKSFNTFSQHIQDFSFDSQLEKYRIEPKKIKINHRKYLCKGFAGEYSTWVTNYIHTRATDEDYEHSLESTSQFVKWLEPKQTTELEIES